MRAASQPATAFFNRLARYTGIITYVIEFDDHAAYAAYTQKAQADQELQTFLARALGGANPAATVVSQRMLVEIPL